MVYTNNLPYPDETIIVKDYIYIHLEDILAIPTNFLRSDSPSHNSSVYVIFYKF